MKIQFKKIVSLFTAFLIMVTIFGGNAFNGKRIYAKEASNIDITVNDAIKVLSDELSKKGEALKIEQNASIYRAGVELKNKASILKNGIDTNSTAIGRKAIQAIILMDMDEDPINYSGKNFIKEIADAINKLDEKNKVGINEIKAINAIDMYNEKYKDKKMDYNIGATIKLVIAEQDKKSTSFNVPQNIAWGLNVFVKHKDIEGTNDAINKALDSLHKFQHEDAGFYLNTSKFSTGTHSEIVTQLVLADQKLDSNEWTKNGKNPIDALFNLWDGKEFKDSNGSRDDAAYDKVLYAVVTLKNSGYGEYILKNAKFDNLKKDEPEKICKVKVRVEANDRTIVPTTEVTVNNFNLTPYGGEKFKNVRATHAIIKALEGEKINCKDKSKFDNYKFISNIDGLKMNSINPDKDGWMYYVNNEYVNVGLADKEIKDEDSIVVYFTEDYTNSLYSYFDQEEVKVKTGKDCTLNLTGTRYNTNTEKIEKVFVNDAKILVNNKEFVINGQYITTDKNGNAILKFDTPGTYTISAVRLDKKTNKKDITRPYCKVVVEQGEVNVNKDTLEKFINESEKSIKDAVVGSAAGQYSQEALGELSKELESAKTILNKESVTQVEINVEVVKLQNAINQFKDSINKNMSLKNFIDDVLNYYNSTLDNQYKSFDFITTLALRRVGMDTDTLIKKINIYGMDNLHNNARNVMTLIGANKDPKNYKGKDYVSYLEKYDFTNEKDAEMIAKAIIALDMSESNYDKDKALKILLGNAHDEGDGKISFGRVEKSYDDSDDSTSIEYKSNIDATAWTLIAISNHRDFANAKDVIEGIKKYFKSNQKPTALIDNTADTALLIQALVLLGENPNDDYWCVKNDSGKTTMLDGILKCKVKDGFGLYNSTMVSDVATSQVLAALTDLNLNSSMYRELRFKSIGTPIKISIDGSKILEIYKGQNISLNAKAYDYNNVVVKDAAISWKSLDDKIASINDGKVTGLVEGEAQIIAYITGNEEVKDNIKIKVVTPPVIDYGDRLKDEVKFLNDHYNAYGRYEFLASPSAAMSGIGKSEIASRILEYSKNNTALQNAKTIIALLGAGLDPKNAIVKEKVVNYVEVLEKCQKTDGDNTGKFILNEYTDKDSIETQAYCILALDAADGKYNKEAAVKALVSMISDSNYKNSSTYKSVKTEAVALIAFSRHKEVEGVDVKTKELIEYLKSNQNDDGGFNMEAGSTFVNSPIATGAVVMALNANGIDPLSFEWTKSGKTVIDSLVKSKFIGRDASTSGYSQGEGLGFENSEATYYAFSAMVERLNRKSIFDIISKTEDVINVSGISIDKDRVEIKEGESIKLNVNVNPENAYNKNTIWTSSDHSTVYVDKNGNVKALKEGKAIITVTTEDGNKTVNCEVTVKKIDSVQEVKVENITGQTEFKAGTEGKVVVRVKNTTNKKQDVCLIVALFDSKDILLDYVIGEQNIKGGTNVELSGKINLSNGQGYVIKGFVWDAINGMAPLLDVIEIPIK